MKDNWKNESRNGSETLNPIIDYVLGIGRIWIPEISNDQNHWIVVGSKKRTDKCVGTPPVHDNQVILANNKEDHNKKKHKNGIKRFQIEFFIKLTDQTFLAYVIEMAFVSSILKRKPIVSVLCSSKKWETFRCQIIWSSIFFFNFYVKVPYANIRCHLGFRHSVCIVEITLASYN